MTITCMPASAVWGGSSSSAAIRSPPFRTHTSSTRGRMLHILDEQKELARASRQVQRQIRRGNPSSAPSDIGLRAERVSILGTTRSKDLQHPLQGPPVPEDLRGLVVRLGSAWAVRMRRPSLI